MTKINIAIDTRELSAGRMTGISRLMTKLLDGLAEINNNYAYYLIVNKNSKYLPRNSNFHLIELKSSLSLFNDQFTIPHEISKRNIKLFFTPYYKCPLFTNVPCLVSLLDLTYYMLKNHYNNYIFKSYESIFIKKAEKILTISNNSKKDILKIFKPEERKIRVIYPNINDKFTPRPETEIRKVLGKYEITKPYILYVGNMLPHKNIKRLVNAYGLIDNYIRSKYELVITGGEKYVEGNINFIGKADDKDIPALYSGAKLTVFPSLYEGFGFPPLEAMACGSPVLSSNAASMPEVLDNACEFFTPQDTHELRRKLEWLLNDSKALQDMKQRGSERAKHFMGNSFAAEIISLFDEVLK